MRMGCGCGKNNLGIESTRGEKTLERAREKEIEGERGKGGGRKREAEGRGKRVKAEDIRNGITNVS